MTKRELNSKSDIEKKDELFQGRPTYRGSELGGDKLEDYFQQISPESSPERLLSILTSPEFSHPINASEKVNMINHLQQTYGNRHVQRMIQAKLKISQPNDKYEQEADKIAEQVMQMPEPPVRQQLEKKSIRTKEVDGKTPELTATLESRIHTLRDSGQPLPESARNFFEPRFGYDFSEVKIHTTATAAELAKCLNARAFTIGRNLVFGSGQLEPFTNCGKRLIAHELAHVIQQNSVLLRESLETSGDNAQGNTSDVILAPDNVELQREKWQKLWQLEEWFGQAEKVADPNADSWQRAWVKLIISLGELPEGIGSWGPPMMTSALSLSEIFGGVRHLRKGPRIPAIGTFFVRAISPWAKLIRLGVQLVFNEIWEAIDRQVQFEQLWKQEELQIEMVDKVFDRIN